MYHTDLKHTEQTPVHQQRRVTRSSNAPTYTVHRTTFRGAPLLFIGYGLQIHKEGDFGMGLLATLPIPAKAPVTQYEVSTD